MTNDYFEGIRDIFKEDLVDFVKLDIKNQIETMIFEGDLGTFSQNISSNKAATNQQILEVALAAADEALTDEDEFIKSLIQHIPPKSVIVMDNTLDGGLKDYKILAN